MPSEFKGRVAWRSFWGGAGNDNLTGGGDDDVLSGGNGNDILDGGNGNDRIDGGAGDDYLRGGAAHDTIIGGENGPYIDQVTYDNSPAGVTVDLAIGAASDGFGGTDAISGVEGIVGSQFSDILRGDSADNWLTGGSGNDTIDGREGSDVVFYQEASQGFDIDLSLGLATSKDGTETDTLIGIEAVQATRFDDTVTLSHQGGHAFLRAGNDRIIGLDGSYYIHAGSGADTVEGGTGYTTVSYDDNGYDENGPATGGVIVNLGAEQAIDNWGATDRLFNVQAVIGSALDDTLIGNEHSNQLSGEEGADALQGGGGNDLLEGGEGNDDLQGQHGDDTLDGGGGNDVLHNESGVDTFLGGDGDDQFILGSQEAAAGELFDGSSGTDTISIGGDNDFRHSTILDVERLTFWNSGQALLTGTQAQGSWTIVGDASWNAVQVHGASVDLSGWTFSTWTSGDDAIELLGTNGGDTLVGSERDDTLWGGSGHDLLEGGDGDDDLQGQAGNDTLNGGEGHDRLHNETGVDRFYGGGGDDEFIVGEAESEIGEVFDGGDGHDTLRVLGTNSFVSGTVSGIERLHLESGGQVTFRTGQLSSLQEVTGSSGANVLELIANSGADLSNWAFSGWNDGEDAVELRGNGAANALTGSSRKDLIVGGDGDDNLNGGMGDDRIEGGLGDDLMSGGEGDDTLDGGAGSNDVWYVGEAGSFGVIIDLVTGTATDTYGTHDTIANIDAVALTDRNDTAFGSDEADFFRPFAGNDYIDGRGGTDELHYANDTRLQSVAVNLQTGTTTKTYADGAAQDTFTSIENIRGSRETDVLIGNAADNRFRGISGADKINGGGGRDQIDYRLDAHYGGSAGIVADLNAHTVTDGFGDTDEVTGISDIQGTDSADVMDGDAADNAFWGQAGNDTLRGHGGHDRLDAGDGNDTLQGGSGDDTILGGAGVDTAVFGGDRADYMVVRRHDGSYTVTDDEGGSGTDIVLGVEFFQFDDQTVSLANLGGEAAPVALALTLPAGQEDVPVVITAAQLIAGASDANGDALAVVSLGLVSGGGTLASNSNGTWIFTPAANYHGPVLFSYVVADGSATATATASVNILAANDAPTGIGLSSSIVVENSRPGTWVGNVVSYDPDAGDGVSYSLVSDGGGRFALDGNRLVVADGSRLDYELASAHAVVVRATDMTGASIDQVLTITLQDVWNEKTGGTTGSDTLAGGVGADRISGGGGNDNLAAGLGKDVLDGGTGNDRLLGGAGLDVLTGGKGRDVFAFGNKDTGHSKKTADYITDFRPKEKDRIDLKGIDANTKKKGDQSFSFIGKAEFSKAGQVRYEKTAKETFVYLNTDTDRSAEGVIRLKSALDLQKGWFIL